MTAQAVKRARMTPATVAAIVAEIKAYERGERHGKLTWKALEAFSGFSKPALWAKPDIKKAVRRVLNAQRANATPAGKERRTPDERISALEGTVEALRENIRAYDELWALYEYNVQRMGWDPNELRRPMDPTARVTVRRRRNLRVARS
jgi:hypothetical protein